LDWERRERWFRALCGALALAITLSTLLVKQHIVPDVLAGGVWGGAAYWASGWVYARLRWSALEHSASLRHLQ
jgi:membrane-associated phospholipid phosphatase